MDDIHMPSVTSGPTSRATTNGTSGKKTLQELMLRKDSLEAELSALGSVLDSHGVNMNTSLTTFDGYPRADLDVAQIRTTRAQIIRLKNDHKSLMKELEDAMHEHFAQAKTGDDHIEAIPVSQNRAPATSASRSNQASRSTPSVEPPFAKVNSIVDSSPAAVAGLQIDDMVTRFGAINWTNHERLSRVAQVVQQNEGQVIIVKVLRASSVIELSLTPRRDWGGRGLLGCHLLPV